MLDDNYMQQLLNEKNILQPDEFAHTIRLLEKEIHRVQSNGNGQSEQSTPGFQEEIIKLTEKVIVPVDKYPKFNFVGKLLGPKGNTLKRLQGNTKTRISILGRGSTRNKEKEEELSLSGDPKHEHLKEPLHVLIEVEAIKSEAHIRLGTALAEIYKYLVPENDELRQQQMREMALLAGKSTQKQLDNGSNPMITLGIPTQSAFLLNELHGSVAPRSDIQPYDKYDASWSANYDTHAERNNYQAKHIPSRKRSYPSNGYPGKNTPDSYDDY